MNGSSDVLTLSENKLLRLFYILNGTHSFQACNIMTNYTIGTALDRFAQVNNLLLAELGDNCVDFKYHQVIHQLKNISQNSEVAYGGGTFSNKYEFNY